MNGLLLLLALGGLFGCYDLARRMNRRTNHGIRVAVWIIGFGCIAVLAGMRDVGLALVLTGLGVFRACDRRTDADALEGRRA